MEFMQFIITLIAFSTAVGGASWWLYHRIIRPLHDRLVAAAELIEAQLTPNHGSSLIDKVQATQKSVNHLERQFENIEKRVQVLETK